MSGVVLAFPVGLGCLFKSYVEGHYRTTKTGKRYWVGPYSDRRFKRGEAGDNQIGFDFDGKQKEPIPALPGRDESRTLKIVDDGNYEFGLAGNVPHPSVPGDKGFSLKMRKKGADSWEEETYGWAPNADAILDRVARGRSSAAGPIKPEWIRHPELARHHDKHMAETLAAQAKERAEREQRDAEHRRQQENEQSIRETMEGAKKKRGKADIKMNNGSVKTLTGWQYGDFLAHKAFGRKSSRFDAARVTHVPTGQGVIGGLKTMEAARELAYRLSLTGAIWDGGKETQNAFTTSLQPAIDAYRGRAPISRPKTVDGKSSEQKLPQFLVDAQRIADSIPGDFQKNKWRSLEQREAAIAKLVAEAKKADSYDIATADTEIRDAIEYGAAEQSVADAIKEEDYDGLSALVDLAASFNGGEKQGFGIGVAPDASFGRSDRKVLAGGRYWNVSSSSGGHPADEMGNYDLLTDVEVNDLARAAGVRKGKTRSITLDRFFEKRRVDRVNAWDSVIGR